MLRFYVKLFGSISDYLFLCYGVTLAGLFVDLSLVADATIADFLWIYELVGFWNPFIDASDLAFLLLAIYL